MQPISTSLLSFGLSGKIFHAPFLQANPGFALKSVWERSKNEAQAVYPALKVYRQLEDLLADPTTELVVVNTPTHCHAEHARLALEAGKHVVVEKAFTTTLAEAQALADLARSKGLVLCVYQNRRWDSDFLQVQSVVNSGQLGQIREVHLGFERFKPALSPKQHKEQPGPGAGLLMDLGPHLLDQALALFGPPQAHQVSRFGWRPQTQVDDAFVLQLFYPDKTVTLRSSLTAGAHLPAFVLQGSQGSFVQYRNDPQEADLMAGKRPAAAALQDPSSPEWGLPPTGMGQNALTWWTGETLQTKALAPPAGSYGRFYDLLHAAIRHQGPPPVPLSDSLHSMAILAAAAASPIHFAPQEPATHPNT